jgi:hypothetical protein
MEEKQLSFRSNDDPTPVVFDEEKAAAFMKAYNDLRFGCQTLLDEVKGNRLTVGYQSILASCIENYTQELTKILGYEGIIATEKEERYKEIREANDQNRQLRKQLGEKVSPEDLREGIKNLDDTIARWWNIKGLGHISGEGKAFGSYGAKVVFSGMFTDAYYAKSKDSAEDFESSIEKAQRFISEGFDVDMGEGSRRDQTLLNTENNVKLLTKLFTDRFPSAKINEIKIVYWGKRTQGQIRDIEVYIRNFDDIQEKIDTVEVV